jgi:ribulose-5-phosphate 4-epimerase/fuculose-1-phosphate aldolase
MSNQQPADGSVKFSCHLTRCEIVIPEALFNPLNHWRNVLREKGLIGAYPDGIGYGNISVRVPGSGCFYISGTATGGIPVLEMNHYALVERCESEDNTLWCRGQINASAESMSHAAIYEAAPDSQAVVHIHNRWLWEKYRGVLPTTSAEIEYGTPAMAAEIRRMAAMPEVTEGRILVMGGHEEGIISFGQTVEEAAGVVLGLF